MDAVHLGTVFLEEYAVGLDFDNSNIGVSGYVQQLPPEGEEPSEVPLWGLILLILFVSMAIIAAITVCVLQRKRGVKVEKKEILQT
jgi:hypothetical protein